LLHYFEDFCGTYNAKWEVRRGTYFQVTFVKKYRLDVLRAEQNRSKSTEATVVSRKNNTI